MRTYRHGTLPAPLPAGGGMHARMSQVRQSKKGAGATERLEDSPLYGVAMLKIAMELKKPEGKDLDEILSGVLERMRIPEPEFRALLSRNQGLLRTLARKRQY